MGANFYPAGNGAFSSEFLHAEVRFTARWSHCRWFTLVGVVPTAVWLPRVKGEVKRGRKVETTPGTPFLFM